MRVSWDETWMKVADAMAARSKCTNRQVGAVIVDKSNRPISMGYNGAPAGHQPEPDVRCGVGCPRSIKNWTFDRGSSYENCVSVHAEANALLFADRSQYNGGTIYVTNPCCWECAKLVSNSGIARVVLKVSEADSHANIETPIKFMESCGLQVDIVS